MIPLKLWGGFFDVRRIPEIAAAFLTGHESGHLWFLTALFWCFTVFLFIAKTVEKKRSGLFSGVSFLYFQFPAAAGVF